MSRRTGHEEQRIVDELATAMLRKFRVNRPKKKHWSEEDIKDLFCLLKREVDELEEAIRFLEGWGYECDAAFFSAAIDECADVANFAAMIADNLRGRSR